MKRRSMHRAVVIVIFGLASSFSLNALPATAQQPKERVFECVIDSAKALRIDTLSFYLVPRRNSALNPVTQDRVAQVVASHYEHVAGAPLGLVRWTGAVGEWELTPDKPRGIRGEPRGAEADIQFGDGGKILRVVWAGRSLSPTVEQEVASAMHRADSSGAWKAMPELEGQSVRLLLTQNYDTTALGIPILRTTVRYLVIEEPARVKKPFMPRYPASLQANAIQGHVNTAFIIGVDGMAEPNSLEITGGSARYEEFVESARESVLKTTFTPARVQGCPVRQQVYQRVSFKL